MQELQKNSQPAGGRARRKAGTQARGHLCGAVTVCAPALCTTAHMSSSRVCRHAHVRQLGGT